MLRRPTLHSGRLWLADRAAGTLTVRVVDTPSRVMLWQASNPKARDFRLETIGPTWTSTPLSGTNGIYTATVAAEQGWSAFFVELTFPGPGSTPSDTPLVFTTEVVVPPDVYPFDAPPGWGGASQAARRLGRMTATFQAQTNV